MTFNQITFNFYSCLNIQALYVLLHFSQIFLLILWPFTQQHHKHGKGITSKTYKALKFPIKIELWDKI